MNESEKRKLEIRLEKLENSESKLDRHEFIIDVCVIILTILASCVFIAETITIVIGIVSS